MTHPDAHPHDVALLYDLVDGRLGDRAAEELRRRIDEEPDLRATWEEIGRLRESLRGLRAPGVPADFLERVRARGAIPSPSEGGTTAPAGRLLRWRSARPWLVGAAAVALAVLGGEVFLAVRDARESAPLPTYDVAKGREGSAAEGEPGYAAHESGAGAAVPPTTPSSGLAPPPAAGPPAGGVGRGRAEEDERRSGTTRAPGGAVPPGLREPPDAPPPPAGAPAAEGRKVPGAGGTALAPDTTTGVPEAASGGGGGGFAPTPPDTARVPETAPADPSAPVARAGETWKAAADAAKAAAPVAFLSWARAGADEVLVLRADSADEARAQVGLLVRALEGSTPLPDLALVREAQAQATHLSRLAGRAKGPGAPAATPGEAADEGVGATPAPAPAIPPPVSLPSPPAVPPATPPPAAVPQDGASPGAAPAAPGRAAFEGASGASRDADPDVLLTFRLDLDPSEWERLSRALADRERADDDKGSDSSTLRRVTAGSPGMGGEPALPATPSVPAPSAGAEPTPPVKADPTPAPKAEAPEPPPGGKEEEKAGSDRDRGRPGAPNGPGPGAPRRVRIVVLPR